jgi:hypothetical protein
LQPLNGATYLENMKRIFGLIIRVENNRKKVEFFFGTEGKKILSLPSQTARLGSSEKVLKTDNREVLEKEIFFSKKACGFKKKLYFCSRFENESSRGEKTRRTRS